MRADILIAGQGLAGTMLGWEFEHAGFSFEMADSGNGTGASRVGAGMINPVSGQRFTKTWRIDEWLPVARAAYARAEELLGIKLWEEKRLCIQILDTASRARIAARRESGELDPYLQGVGSAECWVRGAARVDLAKLLEASARRWRAAGKWRGAEVDPSAAAGDYQLVIDCRGVAATGSEPASGLPWKFSKGETVTVAAEGLEPDLILHAGGHWLLPVDATTAVVGATHEPDFTEAAVTAEARETLQAAAEKMLGRPVQILAQAAGVRVHLPDKHPVAGRHPGHPRLGIINALGGKGTLWAPALARQWVHHLAEGIGFSPEVAATRFLPASSR